MASKLLKSVRKWRHPKPAEYATKLSQVYGPPTGVGKRFVAWEDVRGYVEIVVRDEYIAHDFPVKHRDFVYSYAKFRNITPAVACKLMKVTGSIGFDLLRKIGVVRCASLGANASSLSFIQDVIDGKARATKREYARRMKEGINNHPRKFPVPKELRSKK